MAFTINDNPDKYDLWIYDGTGLNPISPNPNNIFIKNGVKNIFCMPAIERATSNIPNGHSGVDLTPGTTTCNGTTYTSSGVQGQPFLTAISPHYAVGAWHYFNHGGGNPFPIKFWYRHANSGSGGFITRFVSNMLSFNDRDAWRFCSYKSGSNFDNFNADLLLYKFSEPLPDDADFAILPIFNDKKLWRKNISTNSVPGVHLDQDSRLIPGKVYISSYVSNDTDYCQTDDINSFIDSSIGCKIGINLTQISATFISDIFTITDNYERSNYLNFLQESGNYYDKIFRSIAVLVGDSSRPFFEICLHSNSLILYSCAEGGTSLDSLYPISDNNYLCNHGGVTGDLISTSMFGLNYNEDESRSSALILGRDLMGGTTEEQNEAIKMIPVKAIDERYNHQFTLISDTINMDHASMYDNDLKYSHGFDFCFYVDKNSFNPSSLANSPFIPNGSFITDARKRNTLDLFGTYNYLKLKYSQNNNNPRYSDGLWNEDNLKNIIFLGIEDINYGGNYGSFTLFSDFKAPLSANTFESFNAIRNTQSYKTARIKIIDYLTLHSSFINNNSYGKGRQICWLDLIGSVNYKPPYIGSEINDGYWDSVTEEQKSRIFDAWDIVYSGIIELCPVISFSVLDSVNTSYSGTSTWRELSDLRIKIAVEYIKRYCYLRNIECPKIIPACDSTAGFNNYNSCGESDSSSQRLRPLSNDQFLNNQIIPVLSSGVDGLLLRSTDLYDLVHAGYPGVATVAVDELAQKKFAFNYICNDSSTIKLYDCDYYDSIETYTICEAAYYIFPTQPPSHSVPDYAGVRLNAFAVAQQYLYDKLKLINSACIKYKTHKHNSNGMKNDLILNNGFIPWGSNLLEYSRGFNSLEYIHKLFNNKNIYINNSIRISAQHYLYDPIYTSGTDWDPNSLDTSVYDADSSYSTGDIVKYFNESIYKWVVFKCISDVSSGEYPGRTNYFTGTGNNKEYLLSNIDYKWEAKDIAVLYDSSLNIKSPNAILSNNSDLISYHDNSKYFIFAHTTPWLIPEDTMCESFAYLMHDQGNLITKNGYNNYNDIGHFVITSGGNNYGFANEYIEDVTDISDTMISKFIGLENNSSLLDNNKGIISDFIYWYRNIAYGDSKKIDTSSQLSAIIVSNNFYNDSNISTISSLSMSGSITRYQLLEYSQSVISSIKRNTLFRNSYVCNFGSFGSISGSVRMDQMPSIDYDRSEANILDSLKQITENYSHPNTFSINLFENIDPYSDLSYIVDTRYPQSWKNRTSGIIDNNFKDSHGVEIFSDTVLNERLYEIGWRLNSDKSGIIRFTVHNKSSTYLLLHSNIDNSIFFNDLNIGYISLEIQELIEEDGSEFWLCKLFISFINEDELASFIESGLSKIYINNLIGELSVLEGMGMACNWKISKSGIEYLENNLVNSFNPSILFSILENNSFESFYIGEDINIPISIWHNDADVIHYNQSYKYSAKSLSRLLSLSDNGSYFTTYEINGKSAKQFGANCNEIIIGGVNIINNGLDSFNYEKLRKYIIVYNIQDNDTMSIDASCGFVPLWVSKYGLEEPIFRCNKRYQHKNNDHVSFQSFDYNGFFDHDKYGASLENSQSSYESYNDFVSSFLRISRILRPNIKIISSLSVLNKHDNNLLSCFYHPKELCYYIARPWLMSNYAADSLHIQDDIKALLDGCFLLSYPSVPDASSGFRLGLELGLFDGNILDTESAWVFENSSEFNWDDVDRGGMLWSNYGELSMTELGYTSLNGNDSSFNKPKIVIFIKQVLDLYIRDVCSEMKTLINDPISYQIPSNSEVGYGKVSFIQGIVLTSTNELKIEIVGAADYSEEDWKSYKVEWYKGKTYIDDTYGFILCNEQSGSGFINFIYGSQALAQTFINGDTIKIKLFINNRNGINYGFSNFSEVYFEVSVQNSQVYFVPSTNLNTRSTNVIQIIDPVTLGASTEIIPIDLPPPFSALNYEIWAASWNVPSSFAKSIVPFIKIEGTESDPFFGGPSTSSPSDDIVSDQSYNKFKELIDKIPNGRRVLLPIFWSQNPVSKNYSPLSKIQYYINLDGTSLNGVDMLWSLWQDNCIIDAKVSFNNFISRCKDDEISFDYISDYSVFSQGDTSSIPNLRIKPGSASGTGNRHYTGYEWSVETALESIVKDSRFSSYTNSITGTTAENDFMERYERSVQQFFDTDRSIYPTYPEEWYVDPKQTALEALTPIFGYSANLVEDSSNLSAFIAWNSMVTDMGNAHYRTMLFKNTLDANGFTDVTISVFGQYNLSTDDAKYVQDINGFISSPNNFSSLRIENSPILYGLADQITTNVGYHTNPSNDDQSYMFVNIDPTDALPSGVSKSLLSPLWIAFLNDIIRMRSCIRSSENAWKSFSPWISDPEDILTNSKYNSETYGDYYWKELIFHVCLHGASRINYFNIANSDKAMNDALNEWRNISLNSRARPCSNSSGDVSQEIDRIHIKDSTEVLLISGGRLLNSNKYIWRITAPPHKLIDGIVSFRRLGNDSDLPERIDVADGFGAWVIRDVPNPPTYETYSNFLPEPTSSLDYELWAIAFFGNAMFSGAAQYQWGNPNYPFLSIVPAIVISGGNNPNDVDYNGFRYPGDTNITYIPQSQFNTLKERIMSVPATRRVLSVYYWWSDIGIHTKLHYEYYKNTADGTDYEGDRILTPWLNQNMEDGKLSVASFLTKCISEGIHFDYFMDDKEAQDVWFLDGRNTNNYWGGPNDPNPGLWYKSPMPDARTMSAVAADARFTTFVNPVSEMTFAEEFIDNYKNLTNQPNLTITWQDILEPFINVTNKTGFIAPSNIWTPYGCSPAPCGPEGFDQVEDGFDKFHYVIPAWNSVVSNLYFNYYINDMQHAVLQTFPEFQSTKVIHYNPHTIVNAEESHFYQGSNLDRNLSNSIQNGLIGTASYGIAFNIVYPNYAYPQTSATPNFINTFPLRSGYIKTPQNDNEKYTWNGNLVTAYMGPAGNSNIVRYPETNPVVNGLMDSALLQNFWEEIAFKFVVNDLKRIRSFLRSNSSHWESFSPWISDPFLSASIYYHNNNCISYWYELIFHICLSGAQTINYFREFYDPNGCRHVNDALNEWRNISFNSKARPCSNSSGDVNTPVDRFILSNIFEDVLISGGFLLNSNKYLWRITVAPKHFSADGTCVLQRQGDDSDIPEFITIVSDDIKNSKGAWIKRNFSTPPIYKKYDIDIPVNRDLDDRAQYFSRIQFDGGVQDQHEWNSWGNNTIAIFSGGRITGNESAIPMERPYGPFVRDPVLPEVSSPWHNLVYELAYPIYKWGNRSFHFQFPFGGPRNDMESLEEKSGYDSPIAGYIRLKEKYPTGGNYTSDFACPSRWRGMKEAFNALLRGKLIPTSPGYEAMTEPSNIVLYLPGFMGFANYREETCGYWDNLPGSTEQKDTKFYQMLDQYIADLVYIKNNGTENKGKLYICLDTSANSATPESIDLYRTIPKVEIELPSGALAEFGYKASDPSNWPEVSNGGYRSDKLELADWHVKTKLEAAGIIVSQEAIPPSTSNQIKIGALTGNYYGERKVYNVPRTLYKNFTAVEGTMWVSRSYSAPFDLFDDILRWPSNGFEIVQALPDGNPFNQPLQVQIQNGSQLVTRKCSGMSGLVFSPFYYLHTLNAVIDHIKYIDKTIEQDTNKTDIKLNHKNIIVIPTGIFASNLDEPYANASTADITKYYVHPGTLGNAALELRPALDKQSFINNSDDYTGGLWTTANKDYWDTNLRSTSFTNFMENIRAKSKLVSPPKEIFDTGITLANGFTFEQTYPYDSISKGILSGIYEPEPRSQIYALTWISTKGNVADWSDGGVDITPVTDFTHIKPMVAIKGSYGFTPSPPNGGKLGTWMSSGAGWQIPIIRNQLRVLENNNNLANTNIKSIRTIYYDQSWLFGHDPFVPDPALRTNPIDYYNPIVTSNVETILYPDFEMPKFIADWEYLLNKLDQNKMNADGLLIRNTRLVGDSETILASGNFQLNEPYFNALKSDPRFRENKYGVDSLQKQLADNGIDDIQWSPNLCLNANSCGYPFPNGEQYLVWNKAVASITTAVLNKVLWEPFVERYKNIPDTTPTGTNFECGVFNFRDGYPDNNGHEGYYDNLFGTSANVHLYGRMVPSLQAWTIDTASPTHLRRRLSDSDINFNCSTNPWHAFLVTVQAVRSCKRGSISKGITTGITPWIAPKDWGGDQAGYVGFVNNSYYDEAIRHEALTGVEVFQIFNTSYDATTTSGIQARKAQFTIINDILIDINIQLGGYTPTTLDDSRVSYNCLYVMSGAPTVNGKYLWRVTPKVSTDTIYSNGVLVPKIGSQIGVWITTTTSTKPNIFLETSSGSSSSSSSSSSDVTYNIYVNGSTGDDSGNGINPVKTIFKAVNLAKAYIDRGGTQNIEIRIHGGTYNMLGTDTKPILYLNSAYNPNGESTLTFKPATQSDEVIISGSDEITWDQFSLIPQDDPNRNLIPSNARENVYVASLSSYDIGPGYPTNWAADGIGSAVGKVYDLPTLPDLIFNDVLMTVARWPNKTTLTSSGIAMEESALIESVVDSGTNSTWTVDRQWLGWNDNTTSDPCVQSAGEDPSPCFRNGTFEYPEEYHSTITKWTSNALAKGIFIKGWWRFDWHSETYKVTAIDLSARTITVESKKSNYGIQDYRICNPDTGVLDLTLDSSFKSNTTKRRWFALNILEELDSPGEYYIDRATKKLYFWPPTQINPQSRISLTHRAVAGAGIKENNQLEVGFATNGSISRENYAYPGWSSEAIFGYTPFGPFEHSRMVSNTRYALKSLFKFNQVKNVIIEGLTFRNSAGSGIELRQCENVIVRNCKIYNINKHGIDAPGGKNVIIDTCTLHDIGLSAIINTGGNRQTLEPSNKLITKCSIKRWGKHESGLKLAAISIHGVGNTVSSNLISDGSTAIYFTYGNNITIEYNHFHNLAKHQDDTGAIYGGRNVSGFDVKIKNNFFNKVGTELDGGPRYEGADVAGGPDVGCPGNIDNNKVVGSHAVYFDDFSCGNLVEGNVFYKCGTRDNTDAVFYNGGIKNEAKNNIFIDCNTAMSDVKTTIANFNIVLADQVFSGLNTQNYPWYENGGPGNYTDLTTLNSATGYSPWTWYLSPTAYPEDRYKGLMQVVDIRTGTYKDAAPWLHSLYQFSNPTPGTISNLTVNPAKVIENRNKQINNVFVNCEKRYKSYLVGDASFPGNTFITGEVEGNTNFFVNYANNNFRLTPSALQSIRNQQSSDFQEIPWDLIPTINR